MTLFKKLEGVEKKFEELTAQLGDPLLIADPQRYKTIAKDHSDLKELVATYRHYRSLREDLESAQTMATDQDHDMASLAQDECSRLESDIAACEEKLKFLLLPKDPNDEKNCLLEIRAGTGGEEAALFAAELFRMYQRYAETKRWKVEILDQSGTGLGGIKEVIALIAGERVFSRLKYESGVHRVQRVPKTEASGRIHTSAVTVAVLPEAEEIDIAIDEKDLRIDVFRASGPGGQGVNRTDSAVRITHLPSGLVVSMQDERSQHKNKARAMKILRSRLLDQKQMKQDAERSATRKSQVGSGDRSEKVRTYNFPQNRLTDHRVGLTLHHLTTVMEGDLDEVIQTLQTHFQTESLKAETEAR